MFHLTRSDLVLGREQGDIVFSDDEFMSRRHALLQFAMAARSYPTWAARTAPSSASPGSMS